MSFVGNIDFSFLGAAKGVLETAAPMVASVGKATVDAMNNGLNVVVTKATSVDSGQLAKLAVQALGDVGKAGISIG